MNRRGRGRPPKSEHDAFGQILWFERLLEEEDAALRRQGCRPAKALARAAVRLGISERSAHRLMAQIKRDNERAKATVASFGAALRKALRDRSRKKNDGTDLLAELPCSAD